jgi:hypothetical protein
MSLSGGNVRASQAKDRLKSTPSHVMSVSSRDARATQAYVKLTSAPTEIPVAVSTSVVFTAEIAADPRMISDSVYLYQCDAEGSPTRQLGRLYDDQTHGDSLSGDNIFSREVTLSGEKLGNTYFKVTAAYRGSKTRVQSGSKSKGKINLIGGQ